MMPRQPRRTIIATAGLLAAFALTAGSAAVAASSKSGKAVTGVAYVGENHVVGALHYFAGPTSDNVLGAGAITFPSPITVTPGGVVHFSSTAVTLFTKTGSLSGTASADVTATSGTQASVTNGKLSLSKGTGSEKGHSLVGTFTGTGNPTSTEYVFNYTATYK
jgi:hypothetical protein